MAKKEWKPGQNQRGIKIGDIVEITAISTTDSWHEHRHSILFQKAVVISIGQAEPDNGYMYEDWYSAIVQFLDHTKKMKQNHILEKPTFLRVQMRKARGHEVSPLSLQFTYDRLINRNVDLSRINKEINNTEVIEQVELPPKHYKLGWYNIWRKKNPVMYKNNAAASPRWRNCATNFPFNGPNNGYMEFKMHDSYYEEN